MPSWISEPFGILYTNARFTLCFYFFCLLTVITIVRLKIKFSEATAKDFQLEVLKSGGYCEYGADFSNDDLSDIKMTGTVVKANESLLVKPPRGGGRPHQQRLD